MSVKLMSVVFAAKLSDLTDGAGGVTQASTAKLVLLALADHANDEGDGAYPGLTRMEHKTGLSRPTIVRAYKTLKHNGMIQLSGKSISGTNNYTILIQALLQTHADTPVPSAGNATLQELVTPCNQGGNATLPVLVTPCNLNHPLTTNQPDKRYTGHPDFSKVWSEIEQLCGSAAPQTALLIDIWLEKHKLERVLEAIQETRQRGARSVQYVNQVLMTWEQHGYPPTREQLIRAREFKPTKGKSNGTDSTRNKVPEYSQADLAAAAEASRMFAVQRARVARSRAASGTP